MWGPGDAQPEQCWPVGHSNHSPRFVIHLHSENPKSPLRTARAPSTHRQHHWETESSHPSLCFTSLLPLGEVWGCCHFIWRPETSITAGEAGREPWWDEDPALWLMAAPPPTVPAGIPKSGTPGTCGGGRDHSTKAGPDPGTPQPQGPGGHHPWQCLGTSDTGC